MSADVRIEGPELVFEIHGVDEVLAIKRVLRFPLAHVASVSTARVPWHPFEQRRGGAALPGVVKDGRFIGGVGREFYVMHDPDSCVTVELRDEAYARVIFEVEDKEAVALEIRSALEAAR